MPKGSKPCQRCGVENALRSLTCKVCGSAFLIKSKCERAIPASPPVLPKPKEVTPNKEEVHKPGMNHILIPAGKCPYKFSEENEIQSWVKNIKTHGSNKGQTYALEAFEYWAGTFLDKFSKEGKRLIGLIKDFV
jgi:hypothetical protein